VRKGIVFDLDGVLYLGERAVDGALDVVSALIRSGCQVFYLTNNSGKTRRQIVNKLRKFGFPAEPENTYCCTCVVARYLVRQKLSPVYLIGTDGLKAELLERGIEAIDRPEVSAVVVGFDPLIDYYKIVLALRAIFEGAKLVVANLDPWYPAGKGKILPGCGAMAGAVMGATGKCPDFVVGKPELYMLQLLCQEHNLSPADICVVGDVLESDIEMASRFGCQSVLFDPGNAFPEFPGAKIRNLTELKRRLG